MNYKNQLQTPNFRSELLCKENALENLSERSRAANADIRHRQQQLNEFELDMTAKNRRVQQKEGAHESSDGTLKSLTERVEAEEQRAQQLQDTEVMLKAKAEQLEEDIEKEKGASLDIVQTLTQLTEGLNAAWPD